MGVTNIHSPKPSLVPFFNQMHENTHVIHVHGEDEDYPDDHDDGTYCITYYKQDPE